MGTGADLARPCLTPRPACRALPRGPAALDLPRPRRAGSIGACSSLLLHATGANRTDKLMRVYLAQYTREVMLNPGTRQLRNNAVPLLLKGEIATVA